MFLKKVSISGFKSFPDPIELGFREGVTAIVGPNGCGKTNIADAIRWALGEQRVKSLRSQQMTDVIFSGSEARKPVGMAEVSLLLSNEDQALPIAYTDILISRRLFRSGESAYLLNRNPCRLKDIHDLLLDTGIGTNTYAIIEQAQVDQILSKEPLERRELFDEAAGIGRYKKSRAEAQKKLAETEEALLRLADRLEELEAQLVTLRREVKKAERHRQLGEELALLEAQVSLYHWRTHETKVEELKAAAAGVEDGRIAVSAELATLDAEITRIREEQLALQNELTEAENRRYASLARVKDFENRLSISQERQAGRRHRRTQIESDITRLKGEREKTGDRLEKVRREMTDLETELESADAAIASCEEALERLTKELEAAEKEAARLGSRLVELTAARDGREQVRLERRARLDALKGELETLAVNIEEEERKREELKGRLGEAASTVEKLEGRLAALQERNAEAVELQQQVNRELAETSEETYRELERLNRARAELESQEKIHYRHEGYRRGVAAVLAAAEKGALPGVIGPLARLVRTEERYEAAIEAALGAAAQAVVCRSEKDAREAVELLRRLRAGRVLFLPLDLLRPRRQARFAAEVKADGLVGDALDLVACDDDAAPAVEYALSGTLVAGTLEEAVAIVRHWRDRAGFRRVVTLEGDVVEAGGVITGGTREGQAEGLLSRVRELALLRKKLEEAEEAYGKVRRREEELRRRFSTADQSLVAQRGQADEARQELERRRLEVESLTGELKRIDEALERDSARRGEVEAELARLEPLPDEEAVGPEEETKLREEHSIALALADRLSAERDPLRDALEKERLAKGRLQSRLEALAGEIERGERDLAALDAQSGSLRDELAGLEQEADEADADLDELSTAVAKLTLDQDGEEDKLQRLRRRVNEIAVELGERLGQRNTVAGRLSDADRRLAELSSSLAGVKAEQERLVVEARERTGHDLSRLEPSGDFDLARAHQRIERLRRHRERLGEINFAAVANYEAARKRRDSYRSRRDELERGAESLRESIRRLNAEASERFLATFNQVVVNFERLFKNLFSGGQARLGLTGEDPLEGGIEVEVRPPGKASQPLLLLSGGERALTAIALLFALFEVKPSPFCILDEIDAPLDDANVDRFLKLLAIFAQKSQFLVVTHNRRTMEAADTLVGVTMVEAGVSRLFTLAFSGGRLVTEEDQRAFSLKRRRGA